MNKLIRSCYK
uniref:Uncharacterized protein n=1 Tax=Anguilla anguilla TaxID=7936 RepID=A0A0E9VIC2_ANGAN